MFPVSQLNYNWTGAGVTMRGFYTGSGSDNRSPGGSQQTGTASQTSKVETGKNVGVMFCIKSKNATVFLTMCILYNYIGYACYVS